MLHMLDTASYFSAEKPPPSFLKCCSLSLDYFEKRSHPAQAFEIIVFFEGLTCFHMKLDMGVKFVSGGIWNRENVWHIKNFRLFLPTFLMETLVPLGLKMILWEQEAESARCAVFKLLPNANQINANTQVTNILTTAWATAKQGQDF